VRKPSTGTLAHPVNYVSGTVFLARSSILREIGLLDEEYFFSGETADICKRARDRGHMVCVHLEAVAEHDTHRTPHHLRDTLYVYDNLRNRFLYVRKHYPRKAMVYFGYWTSVGLVGVRGAEAKDAPRAGAVIGFDPCLFPSLWQPQRCNSSRELKHKTDEQMEQVPWQPCSYTQRNDFELMSENGLPVSGGFATADSQTCHSLSGQVVQVGVPPGLRAPQSADRIGDSSGRIVAAVIALVAAAHFSLFGYFLFRTAIGSPISDMFAYLERKNFAQATGTSLGDKQRSSPINM
jgi:hypothetical protein